MSSLYDKKDTSKPQTLAYGKKVATLGASTPSEISGATALRIYLEEKIRILPVTAKSQRTMIAIWLLEVYLHQIVTLGGSLQATTSEALDSNPLVIQFKEFLRSNR
jgi:hypothetical protein